MYNEKFTNFTTHICISFLFLMAEILDADRPQYICNNIHVHVFGFAVASKIVPIKNCILRHPGGGGGNYVIRDFLLLNKEKAVE